MYVDILLGLKKKKNQITLKFYGYIYNLEAFLNLQILLPYKFVQMVHDYKNVKQKNWSFCIKIR